MGRRKAQKPLPPHLEELILLLEAQDAPDRAGAIAEVERKHEVSIDFDEVLAEHEAFAERYQKWLRRLLMSVQDQHLKNVLSGNASATSLLKAQGMLGDDKRRDNGRLQLGARPPHNEAALRKW